MKRLLAFLFSVLPAIAWGATPTFDSFRGTNSGFIVHQPYIYVANTNTGGTNVIINGDVIYTNTTISYFNTTNNYDGAIITITNSTVTFTNSTVTINGTNVATINPTIGRIPFKFSDFQFGDSALYYIDTNTVGTTELDTDVLKLTFAGSPTHLFAGENDINVTDHSVLVLASTDPSAQLRLNSGNGNVTMMLVYHAGTTAFSLLNGDSLWDGSGGKIYLSGGDWHPTGDGESMLMFKTPIGWSEAARLSANTNVITQELWETLDGLLLQPLSAAITDVGIIATDGGTATLHADTDGSDVELVDSAAGFVRLSTHAASTLGNPALILADSGNGLVDLFPGSTNGGLTPFRFISSHAISTGNLMEVANDGTNVVQINYTGTTTFGRGSDTLQVGGSAGGIGFVTGASGLELFGGTAGILMDGSNKAIYPTSASSDQLTFGVGTNVFKAIILGKHPPANSTDTGTKGQIAWDSGFLYVCITNNVWVRAALSTF